jgi:hypothetical protein
MTVYKGATVQIGDESVVIPPLSLGQLRNGLIEKLAEHDQLLADGKTFEMFVKRGEIIFEALKRNYPDFDQTKFFDFLDVRNTQEIWLTVLGMSGFTQGEAQAATEETKTDGT